MGEPKQERAVRTREVVLHAAAEVFDECGYSGASISKIMKRAGVTQGGMYFHFDSKLKLAQAVMADQQSFVTLPATEGLQGLVDVTFHLSRELQSNPVFRASVRLAVEQGEFGSRDDRPYQEWAEQFRRQLDAAHARGELLPDTDTAEFARVLVGAYSGTQLFSQMATNRADLPEQVATLWRYLLPAVATPQVIATLRLDPQKPTV